MTARKPEWAPTPNVKHNRYRTRHEPVIRKCKGTCGRMTRPSNWLESQAPGTVGRRDGRFCKQCHRYEVKGGKQPEPYTKVEPEAPTEAVLNAANGVNRYLAARAERAARKARLESAMAAPHKTAVRTAARRSA